MEEAAHIDGSGTFGVFFRILLPLAANIYFGQYTNEWHLAMAALTMAVVPIILFFLFMQRYII